MPRPEPKIVIVNISPFGIDVMSVYSQAKTIVHELNRRFRLSNFNMKVPDHIYIDRQVEKLGLPATCPHSQKQFKFHLKVV